MINILKRFFDFCGKENKKKFYTALVLGVVYAMLEAVKIPAILLLLEGAINQKLTGNLILTCLGMLVASLAAAAIVKYRMTMLQCEAGYYTTSGKRIEIAEHMRYLPMGYFNKNSLGQITNVTTNTMEQMADVATRVVMMTTQGILTTAIITIMLLCFDVRIGVIAVIGMIIFFFTNSFLQKRSKALAPRKAASDETVVEKVLEYVQGIAEVRSYNMVGSSSKELNDAIEENRNINTTMELKLVPLMQVQNLILKLMGVVMIMTSSYFYLAGSMSLQNCIGMIICSFLVFESLGSAGNFSTLLRVVDLGVSRVEEVMKLKEMDIDGKEITPENYDIDVKNVDFYYDENQNMHTKIIDNVSVHIPEKTVTAIVGPSGGGKTTLCHLISRFWDVSSGSISLGGEDVKNYSMDSLMKNFSFVFQNVYLFEDTIANNIRFGRPDASMEQVMEAAKAACCHDFIMRLPNGYETVIGEGGASLSGGEKQRISIARAIMKDAPIIILDEATANVDPENEKDLMTAIDALTKEKTLLMIAHRLKTVEHANQILVLDQGRIVQQGKHQELIEQTGIYRNFIMERKEAVGWKL
ncbi:MAG: ABC transporter ATP-binding protein [bacterium]|nr:ABC transporter ATP-binding protein [bacterium]